MSVSNEVIMKTFTIHVDFDGRREDGEYLDGQSVQATCEAEAWEKFSEEVMNLNRFGDGFCISSEEEDE